MHHHFHGRASLMAFSTIRFLNNNIHNHHLFIPTPLLHFITCICGFSSFHTCFQSSSSLSQSINPNFITTFKFTRLITSKSHKIDLPPDSRTVVDGLVCIFNHQQFLGNEHELSQLGYELTHDIVETVLNSLNSWKTAYRFFIWAKEQNGYVHNCYTYNTMASILSNNRQIALLRVLASDIVNSRCCLTPGALGFFVRCLGSVGLVDEASVLFDQVRELGLCIPNNYSYNCLLETLSKSKSSDQAEMRIEEMHSLGWMVDKFTLTPLLQVYCNSGEFRKGLSIFNHMCEMGWTDSHVLCVLVLSLSKQGEVNKAFEVVEKMEKYNLRLNQKTFYVLIHGFVSASRVDKAYQLFEKMCKSGYSPDIAVYDVLIEGLYKNEEHEKALELYSAMKNSHGISPDVGILKRLLSCVSDEAVMAQLLEENCGTLGHKSLTLLCNCVLNGFVGSGSNDRAYNLIKVMMGDETQCDSRIENFFKLKGIECLDSSSFSVVIGALCRNGKLDEALTLFRGMDKIRCQKDVLLYNNLIDALCSADRIVDGLELFSDMKNSGLQPTHFTYNSIYGYYCRKGDVIEAMSLVKEMCLYRHQPWIKNSTTLVQQLCKHGKAGEASNFLSEMVKLGLVPHLVPYSAAIDGFFKLREVDVALELFYSICSRGYKPDVVACNILINGLCKVERMSKAQDVLSMMLARGLVPSSATYNSLINGWCKSGNPDQALVCFSKMADDHIEPNVITYTTLIDGLCNGGRADDAVMLWKKMEEKISPNRITFMVLICGLCKNEKPDVALLYLRKMEERGFVADSYVYATLLNSFILNKNPTLAVDILKEMIDKDKFPEPGDKNHKLLTDAIAKLKDDEITSNKVNSILEKKHIPSLC